jgi:hypothetical protein
MADREHNEWLTVRETAKRLNTSEEMVRRKIRAFELPASRLTDAARAPWMIDARALEQQLQADAQLAEHRESMAGVVVGRSDEGGPLDEAFRAEVERLHGKPVAAGLKQVMDRSDLFARVERDMYADPSLRMRFEQLDEEQRFEEEARELARRVRRAERLRDRALEILEEEDLDG